MGLSVGRGYPAVSIFLVGPKVTRTSQLLLVQHSGSPVAVKVLQTVACSVGRTTAMPKRGTNRTAGSAKAGHVLVMTSSLIAVLLCGWELEFGRFFGVSAASHHMWDQKLRDTKCILGSWGCIACWGCV